MTYRVYFSTLDGFAMSLLHRLTCWLIRFVSLSRIVHCALADERVALNPGLQGNTYWARSDYERHYRGIIAVVEIDAYPINLAYFEYGVGVAKRWWPTLWRRLTGSGGKWTDDCLCTTIMCLVAAGVPVPYDTHTPAALLRWLKSQGYPYAERRDTRGNAARCRWVGSLAGTALPDARRATCQDEHVR